MTHRTPLTLVRKTTTGWSITPTNAWPERIIQFPPGDAKGTAFESHRTAVHTAAIMASIARRAAIRAWCATLKDTAARITGRTS